MAKAGIMKLILVLIMGTAHAGWWQNFCAKYLVTNDHSEFDNATVDMLVRLIDQYNSPGAYRQARLMVQYDVLNAVDDEILFKAIVRYESRNGTSLP